MRTSRNVAIAALATVLGIAFTGCGTDDSPESKPTSGASAAESSLAPTEPAVPAGWKAASAKVAQLHVPSSWGLDSHRNQARTMIAPENKVGLSPGSGEIMADTYGADGDLDKATEGLAKLVHQQLKKDSSLTKLERLPDETLNGALFYHFRAETEYAWQDHYGTVAPTREQVTVTWQFNKSDIDRKDAEALIAPIMATYEVL